MKLRIVILPFIIFGLFGYGVAKLEQNSDKNGVINVKALKADVKEDFSEFKDFVTSGKSANTAHYND